MAETPSQPASSERRAVTDREHHDHRVPDSDHDTQHREQGCERWSDAQLMLTAEEAAQTLKVGRTTLYGLIRDGQLRAVHIGRSCRLTRAELIRYVERLDGSAHESVIPAPATTRRDAAGRPARLRTVSHQGQLFDLEPPPEVA
jgi:excisionase family DNA binding protein